VPLSRLDALTRAVSSVLSRRGLAGALGLGLLAPAAVVDARKKHKHKKKQKAKFNDFGCVDVGDFCKNDGQCCSGICEGKKCQAHDVNGCQTGQRETFCGGGADSRCTSADGSGGFCDTTTGNAGYCARTVTCAVCKKDADCVPFCGPRAACLPCPGEPCIGFGVSTACASTAGDCNFPP
jgi:hypothetical protein